MRHLIEISDAYHFSAFVTSVQATQKMEEELGPVSVDYVVFGMQHQLGMIAANTMSPERPVPVIADDLLGLIALATIYLKSLLVEECPDESQH